MESLYASKEWNETRREEEKKERRRNNGHGELVSASRLSRRRFTKRDCPAKRLVLDGKVGGLTGGQAGRQGRGKVGKLVVGQTGRQKERQCTL